MLVTTAEVDEIRKAAGSHELFLYLDVEQGEWLLPRAVFLLQEKLNAYASFVLDGKMREIYPWAVARNVRVVVRSRGQPPLQALELIARANGLLGEAGPVISLERVAAPQ